MHGNIIIIRISYKSILGEIKPANYTVQLQHDERFDKCLLWWITGLYNAVEQVVHESMTNLNKGMGTGANSVILRHMVTRNLIGHFNKIYFTHGFT